MSWSTNTDHFVRELSVSYWPIKQPHQISITIFILVFSAFFSNQGLFQDWFEMTSKTILYNKDIYSSHK